MVRPLLEIEQPYLTREQMEAAIWRLTGLKNAAAVEQLLRLSDVYAVSQGPALIDKLRERDRSRERWKIELPLLGRLRSDEDARQAARLRLTEMITDQEPGDGDDAPAPDGPAIDYVLEAFDFSVEPEWEGKPPRAAAVWELPDGRMFQRCGSCGKARDYEEFHRDSTRWNSRSSQCKPCKNGVRGSYRPRARVA